LHNLLATDVPRSQQGVVRGHSDVGTLGQVKIIKAGHGLDGAIEKSESRDLGLLSDCLEI